MATRSGKFKIVGGPGKWDMMLAVFHGERVDFRWGGSLEMRSRIYRLWGDVTNPIPGLEIVGVSFYGSGRVRCNFTTMFSSGGGARTMVHGEYNLETREDEIDLTPLCECGILPWPTQA